MKEYSIDTTNTDKKHQVAIVMGGFGAMNRQTGQMCYEEDRADRLWEAVRLWKTGKVERILITGDPTSIIAPDGSSTTSLFLSYMEEMGVPKEIFVLEQQARNTRENALNTEKILKELNIKDSGCILITSATHMERSMKCFAKIGIKPDYLAVNKYDKPRNINHRSFYPEWKAAVEWQELLNEWIGDGIYRVMGYV